MDRRCFVGVAVAGAATISCAMSSRKLEQQTLAYRTSFNRDWKFHKGAADHAMAAAFDDAGWRKLDLPHDWAIEGPFDVKYNARCGGLPFHGTGWYRKTFEVPAAAAGKRALITFEGAMYDAHVWVNGQLVGNRPYGYIEFQFDITDYLNVGGPNVIAVRLTPQDLSTRWYPGAGIYRDVWLDYRDPIHVAQYGTYITTPEITADDAVVEIETTLAGDKVPVEIQYDVLNPDGKNIHSSLHAATGRLKEKITIDTSGALWGLDHPNLHTLVTTVLRDGAEIDRVETRFGIRTLEFTKAAFKLNGKPVRIQGVCLHHDNGPLGSVANRRAIQRKLEIMKSMGVNSVRTSHNPPSRALLDLCDEMGLLVMDEAFDVWLKPKVPNGYNQFFAEWGERDIKDMVRRDRNHPCVFMWSIGNEILEQGKVIEGPKLAKQLHDFVRAVDPTRPTACGFNWWPGPYKTGMAGQVDIAGMNYKPLMYGARVNEYLPNNPVIGSETSSCVSSRGVYHLPLEKYKKHPSKQVTSYDIIGPPWAYPPDVEFAQLAKNPEVYGEYIWTGFDYLGEPTPYGGRDNNTNGYWNADWPSRSSYFGAVDLCGFPKDRFYLYQSQWTQAPMVHVLPHWNWEGTEHARIPIMAYTNCEEVELFVNGESLGRKVKGRDLVELPVKFNHYEGDTFRSPYRLAWEAPFAPGSLKVVGYVGGKAVAEKEIKTAGAPARIRLIPDRATLAADGADLSYVTVRIEDAHGNFCPLADNAVRFKLSGAGQIAAVGNGNAATTAPFVAHQRDAFNGLAMVIVQAARAPGSIQLIATSKGLESAEVVLHAE